MISNYIHPQLRIFQTLQKAEAPAADRLHALVVGPQYAVANPLRADLSETPFSEDSTTTDIDLSFVKAGKTYSVEDDGLILDEASLQVYAKNVEGVLLEAEIEGSASKLAPREFRLTSDLFAKLGGTGTLLEGLDGRNTQIGDRIYFDGSPDYARTVVELLPKINPSTVSDFEAGAGVPLAAEEGGLAITGTYTGIRSGTLFFRVKTLGTTGNKPIFEVYDDAGGFVPVSSWNSQSGALNLGSGLTATCAAAGTVLAALAVDQVFYVTFTAASASTTEFDGVRLDAGLKLDPTGTIVQDVDIVRITTVYSGVYGKDQSVGSDAWSLVGSTPEVKISPTLYVEARTSKYVPLLEGSGSFYATWRAIVPPVENEVILTIDSEEAAEALGEPEYANDLAYGVKWARSGAQGKIVYALRTAGTDAASFSTALRKAEHNDLVYGVVPLTDDLGAISATVSHCEASSAPSVKNFRRCYFGSDSPGEYVLLERDPVGANYTAVVQEMDGAAKLVVFSNGTPDLTALPIQAGDFIEILNVRYKIAEVLDESSVVLATPLTTPISTPIATKVVKANTASSQKAFVISRSQAINSRRAANVWVEGGLGFDIDGTLRVISSKFVAAEIAGLRSAMPPQQGLTRTEIKSVISTPLMFSKYSITDLNDVAANGVMVILQNYEGQSPHIRHQLTTFTDGGILAYEDSIGVNLDSISFSFKDSLDGLIGKRNVTPATVRDISLRAFEILNLATQSPFNSEIGPQLTGFFDEDNEPFRVTVRVHPTFKDRILVKGRLGMPLPNNNTDVDLEAIVGEF
jgi:hypothetical protein